MTTLTKTIVAAMLACGVAAATASSGGHETVNLKAAAVIKGDDLDGCRAEAVAEAKRRCVKSVLRRILGPGEYREHAAKAEPLFLASPDPYLAQFAIVNEEIIDGGRRYCVHVSADVRKRAMIVALLENKVKDISAIMPKPTVMAATKRRGGSDSTSQQAEGLP